MTPLVNAGFEDQLEGRSSAIVHFLTVDFGQASTVSQTHTYWTSSYPVSSHGYYVGGRPPMYSVLPDYTVLAVVNLKTGELIGQMNNHNDLDIDQALDWVDEANH